MATEQKYSATNFMKKNKIIFILILTSLCLFSGVSAYADEGIALKDIKLRDKTQERQEIRVNEGDKVDIKIEGRNYYQIEKNGKLHIVRKEDVLKTQKIKEVYLTVSSNNVTLRDSENFFSQSIKYLEEGDILYRKEPITDENKDSLWIKVTTADGIGGFVYRKLIESHIAPIPAYSTGYMIKSMEFEDEQHRKHKLKEGDIVTLIDYIPGFFTAEKDGHEFKINKKYVSLKEQTIGDRLVFLAMRQLGKPYLWGAEGIYDYDGDGDIRDGFDCSGLTQWSAFSAGIEIPRVAIDQSKYGKDIPLSQLMPGDLLFFDTQEKGFVTHVGMYIGNNQFIHAPDFNQTVKIQEFGSYFRSVFINAKRIYR